MKTSQILNLDYQFVDTTCVEKLNNAFDLLFEETLKKYSDLTTNDN